MVSNSVHVKVLPLIEQMEGLPETVEDSGSQVVLHQERQYRIMDLFITATANKTNLYEQEALLTYKIYTLV